jgi:drug/metabolite transporter (DMT)-like permease
MKPLISKDMRVMLGLLAFGISGGSAFMFVKLLVGEITPLQLTTGRVVMAAVPILAMTVLAGSFPRMSSKLMTSVTLLAFLDTIAPYLLIAWAQLQINSSTAALMVATMPLFTTLIVACTRREGPVPATALAGLGAGFLGMAVIGGTQALNVTSAGSAGVLAAVLAAALYGAAAVYSRTLMHMADPLGLSAVKLAIASLLLVPITASSDGLQGFASLSSQGWLGLLVAGFVSTGLGRWVYQWVIVTAGSVRASLVAYVVPIVALFLGWAVLDEPIGLSTLAGAFLIVLGVAGVMYGPRLKVPWASRRLALHPSRPVAIPIMGGEHADA